MFSLKSLGKSIVQKSFARSLFCQPLRTYLNQDTQRFFMVTYNFAEGVDSQLGNFFFIVYYHHSIAYSWEEHRKKVDALEKEGKILFGGTSTSRESEYFLFNCKDETTPYDFIKSVLCFLFKLYNNI